MTLATDFVEIKNKVASISRMGYASQLAYINDRIARNESSIVVLTRERTTIQHLLLPSHDANQVDDTYEKTFDNLLAMPQIERIEIVDDIMHVYTHDIVVKYHRKNYTIGEFDISIDFVNGTIEMLNLTHRIEYHYDHPHIVNKAPCFGNIHSDVYKYITTCEYGILIPLLIVFLETVNTGEWFLHVDAWLNEEEIINE